MPSTGRKPRHSPATRRNCSARAPPGRRPRAELPAAGARFGHERRDANARPAPTPPRNGRARRCPPARAAHAAGEKQRIGGRIAEAARRPLDVEHEARPEQHADRNARKDQPQRERPPQRQEAPEQANRGSAGPASARDSRDSSRRRQCAPAPAGSACPACRRTLSPAFERADDVAGEQPLEHRARIAVVHQAVVTGVERTHATDEIRLGEEGDGEGARHERERHDRPREPRADQRPSTATTMTRGPAPPAATAAFSTWARGASQAADPGGSPRRKSAGPHPPGSASGTPSSDGGSDRNCHRRLPTGRRRANTARCRRTRPGTGT